MRWLGSILVSLSAMLLVEQVAQGQGDPILRNSSPVRGQDSPDSVASQRLPLVDLELSRYSGRNCPKLSLLQSVRKNSLNESLKGISWKAVDAGWTQSASHVEGGSTDSKVDLQDLLQRMPLAGRTAQIVANQVDSHPQIASVVRFVAKHFDPQF